MCENVNNIDLLAYSDFRMSRICPKKRALTFYFYSTFRKGPRTCMFCLLFKDYIHLPALYCVVACKYFVCFFCRSIEKVFSFTSSFCVLLFAELQQILSPFLRMPSQFFIPDQPRRTMKSTLVIMGFQAGVLFHFLVIKG